MTEALKRSERSPTRNAPVCRARRFVRILLLLLHGGTDSWHSFELVLPHLPDSIRAFALSLRGHGDSSRPSSGYRYAILPRTIAAFMDAVEFDRAVLFGHSMGRAIAQRFRGR